MQVTSLDVGTAQDVASESKHRESECSGKAIPAAALETPPSVASRESSGSHFSVSRGPTVKAHVEATPVLHGALASERGLGQTARNAREQNCCKRKTRTCNLGLGPAISLD